jgi:hypothetical protein
LADWTIERVRTLSDDFVKSLRFNAGQRNRDDVVAICDQVINERRSVTRKQPTSSPIVNDPQTVSRLAKALSTLPNAATVENASRRNKRQQDAAKLTLADLWRQYVVCGLSSNEPSGAGTAVHHFEHNDCPLHHLPDVIAANGAEEWVSQQMSDFEQSSKQAGNGKFRFRKPKIRLIVDGYPLFSQCGSPDKLIAALSETAGPLKLFCDLARGTVSDVDIMTSAVFSANLDPSPYHGIKHKQMRNILVNSGLAVNVLPLDSRWGQFLTDRAGISVEKGGLQRASYYLALEDLIRKALVEVLPTRPDIANLATLDAIVIDSFE